MKSPGKILTSEAFVLLDESSSLTRSRTIVRPFPRNLRSAVFYRQIGFILRSGSVPFPLWGCSSILKGDDVNGESKPVLSCQVELVEASRPGG
jgi:hypothetical protein